MSDDIGPIHLELATEHPFLGRRVAEEPLVSDAMIHGVERESRRLLVRALEHATAHVTAHARALSSLVEALLEHETLDEGALLEVLRREAPIPEKNGGRPVAASAPPVPPPALSFGREPGDD